MNIKNEFNYFYDNKVMACYKDSDFSFVNCDDGFLKYSGIKDKKQILGLTDHDLAWVVYADKYRKHDEDALKGNCYSALVPLCDHKGNKFAFINKKIPRMNDKQKIAGIISHAIEINNPEIFKLIHLLDKFSTVKLDKSYFFDKQHSSIELTEREGQCLFYLIKGKTSKMTANILGISYRTVELYIVNLKIKFNVNNKSELIDKAIAEGFVDIIPGDLSIRQLVEGIEE
jgi:DNA-binding CsgD family transcriptional regulator